MVHFSWFSVARFVHGGDVRILHWRTPESETELDGHPTNHRPWFSLHRSTCCVGAFVAWGAWNAFTDCYPFNQIQVRPSSYIYGWPLCFAASARGRLNVHLIDWVALSFDLAVSAVLVACTVLVVETLLRRFPRYSLSDVLACTTGVTVMLFTWSDGFHCPLRLMLGAVPPPLEVSAIPGHIRLTSRLPISVTLPLSLGLVAVGWTIFKIPLLWCSGHSESARAR